MAPMAYSFAHYCPACRVPSDVYVNESRRPQGSPTYRYQCPRCRQAVTYAPLSFISKTAILIKRGVATLFSAEMKMMVSQTETTASKPVLDSPFLNGNNISLFEKAQ
jgi:transposase-like protein